MTFNRTNGFVTREEIINLLESEGESKTALFVKARETRDRVLGNKVYFRGLIEFSNLCSKDCFYCGIRKSNYNVVRYEATDDEIVNACRFAWVNRFGSVVLQSGELSSPAFVNRVDHLLKRIKQLSDGELGITLSCGEQTRETYQRWRESGAHRYLLRIESSNPDLYAKIHPDDSHHSFDRRVESLRLLKETGYQVGTGVMIGLPFQTIGNLADDLLFFKTMDIDMCGMGPYLEHEDTPFYEYRHLLIPKHNRLELALKMVATLRLLIPDLNIAASTALQAIEPGGRESALEAGANIIMPNLTPQKYREGYLLYEGKPGLDQDAVSTTEFLKDSIQKAGCVIGFGEWGDSVHYRRRNQPE